MDNTVERLVMVSVLMPVYNCAFYLSEAIESILNQTFDDFELIILDDCSTDQSGIIAQSFTDSRIVYHRNEKNLGLANNLNVGLRMAKGKYIARMDGDDISLPERFQTQIDYLETYRDIDLCSCGLQMFGTENTVWVREADPEAVKITMMLYSPVLHATSVWRRESFEIHNLYYDQNAFPAEDYDLWSRAIFHCKLVNIPQILYCYRIHGIQVTKTDDRVAEKDREVRINYLKRSLPQLKSEEVSKFIDTFVGKRENSLEVLSTLKSIYQPIVKANKSENYFRQELLSKRLRRYYQHRLFDYFKTERLTLQSIHIFFDLRIIQIVKLALSKLSI